MTPSVKSAITLGLSWVSCLTLLTSSVPQSTNTQITPLSQEFLAVQASLKKHKVALVGESHNNPEARNFIEGNLDTLRINTVYVEGLSTDVQEELDDFNVPEKTKKDMQALVMHSLAERNPGITYDDLARKDIFDHFTNFLFQLKANGIRVVGLENPKDNKKSDGANTSQQRHELRLAITNPGWSKLIKKDLSENPLTRAVVLTGFGHSRLTLGIPGMEKHLGVPSVDMSGSPIDWGKCATNHRPETIPVTPSEDPAIQELDANLKINTNGTINTQDLNDAEMLLTVISLNLNPEEVKDEIKTSLQNRVDLVCALQANKFHLGK
jgi:hypothetical protein